jgi:hypothetical protein
MPLHGYGLHIFCIISYDRPDPMSAVRVVLGPYNNAYLYYAR